MQVTKEEFYQRLLHAAETNPSLFSQFRLASAKKMGEVKERLLNTKLEAALCEEIYLTKLSILQGEVKELEQSNALADGRVKELECISLLAESKMQLQHEARDLDLHAVKPEPCASPGEKMEGDAPQHSCEKCGRRFTELSAAEQHEAAGDGLSQGCSKWRLLARVAELETICDGLERSRRAITLGCAYRAFDADPDTNCGVGEAELMELGKARRRTGKAEGEWTVKANQKVFNAMGGKCPAQGGVSGQDFVSYFVQALAEESPEQFDTTLELFGECGRICRERKAKHMSTAFEVVNSPPNYETAAAQQNLHVKHSLELGTLRNDLQQSEQALSQSISIIAATQQQKEASQTTQRLQSRLKKMESQREAQFAASEALLQHKLADWCDKMSQVSSLTVDFEPSEIGQLVYEKEQLGICPLHLHNCPLPLQCTVSRCLAV